jgi:omega-6 fatty acid desaturase (delta-12 desaturase)
MTTSLDASETLPLPLIDVKTAPLSGIGGKLLVPREYPSLNEVKAIIPSECYERNTKKSMLFALQDLAGVAACAFAGVKFLLPAVGVSSAPLSVLAWTLYSLITGTVAIGMWVTAHECGHGAFSNNRKLQDFIGYIFHTILLVPYYSWQRSHSVHHAFTNHIDDGETHVPPVKATNAPSDSGTSMKYQLVKLCGKQVGEVTFGCIEVFKHLVVGWPAYIGFGATGGPSRGLTSHFVPFSLAQDRSKELFPPRMHDRVWKSDIGIAAMVRT